MQKVKKATSLLATSTPVAYDEGVVRVRFFNGQQVESMAVDIPTDYFPLVQQLIAEGRFRTESEVIAEGLRLISVKEQLRRDVADGIAELDAGQSIPAADVYQSARERIRKIADEQAK